MNRNRRPPRLARWLLLHALPPHAREFVVGDLDEEFSGGGSGSGRRTSAWYWSQALRSILHASRQEAVMPAPRRSVGGFTSTLAGDVRVALRALARARGYSATAVVTLALGTGASIAIFSAVNEVMLRPLTFAEPGRLAMLWESNEERDWHQVHAAPANVLDWRARVTSLDAVAFLSDFPATVPVGGGREAGQAVLAQVSGNLFDVLGVPPLIGRTFREDETYESDRVVLAHGLWQRQFGADPAIIGRTIRLDGRPYEVIGVMRPGFDYAITPADAWTTMSFLSARRGTVWFRRAHVVRAIGRLAPGATFEQAAAELDAVSRDLERELPDTNRGMRAGLTPLKTFLVGDDRRTTLLLLLAAVGLLQLIACTNVANLTLSRSAGRHQELAVRAALGAGRGRITRYLATESLVLAAAGTTLGVGLGVAGLSAIAGMSPPQLDGLAFRADWRLVLFTVGLGGASAMIFGTWPAWRASRVNTASELADTTRTGSAGRARLVAANLFVAFEVALAVMLVVSAGLVLRSLNELGRVPIGADTANVLTFQVQPAAGTYPTDESRTRLAEQIVGQVAALPGVVDAGVGRGLPLSGYGWSSDFTIDTWPPDRFGTEVLHREATAGYFTVFRIPVLQGRLFEDADLSPGRPVPVVVNRAFAERYFPTESPVGRQVVFDRVPTPQSYWYPIVGVVENERKALVEEPRPEIVAHLGGDPPGTFTFVVRTSVSPLSIVGAVRAALTALDRETPLLRVRTMDDVVFESRASERFVMALLGVFAAAALVLAAVGVYGVASQAARARTREVGIRLALGAPGTSIVRALVLRGAVFVAAGLVAGLAGTVATGRFMSSLLFNVDARDPLTLVAVTILIAAVALASHVWPTWNATRIDPARVLRN